jgi:DNA repair protein RadA/Sms
LDAAAKVYDLGSIPTAEQTRVKSGIAEFDRVMGGGLVAGQVALLGGDPGIGKSTMLLQVTGRLAASGKKCLYVSCEESMRQLKLRAERLGYAGIPLRVAGETAVQSVLDLTEAENPDVLVIDSIQMLTVDGLDSRVGSISHLKAAAAELIRMAKDTDTALFLVGHVTKSGSIAGPKAVEHMVDTVLYFESDRFHAMRILRAVKNRFGSINEIGIFEMGEEGLKEVSNPSELFLAERDKTESGSVVMATVEGQRALLVEVQSLVAPSAYATPERKASGVDYKRLGMLLSVLERRAGLSLSGCDAFANVAGGVQVQEPAADLPIAFATISSSRDIPFPPDAVAMGEVGLSGEVRAVGQIAKRLKEARRLGFERAFIPRSNASAVKNPGLQLVPVRHLREAVQFLDDCGR